MEKIVFTKLNTVKTKVFEHPKDDFFQLLHNAINEDVVNNNVTYNKEEDCYEIVYDLTPYQVYEGNDLLRKSSNNNELIDYLDKLVNYTNSKEKFLGIKKKEVVETNETPSEFIRRCEKGLFNNDYDKKRYLNYLKEKLNDKDLYKKELISKPNLFLSLTYISLVIGFIGMAGPIVLLVLAGKLVPLSIALASLSIVPFATWKFITDGRALESAEIAKRLGRGINEERMKVIILGKIIGNILTKRRIKKKIKGLEKSLSKKERVVEKEDNVIEEEQEKNPGIFNEISKEFRKVNDIILKLNDDTKINDYSKELLTLLNNYKSQAKLLGENGNYLGLYKTVIDSLISLTERVNKDIRKEQQENKTQDEFSTVLEEVEKVEKRQGK